MDHPKETYYIYISEIQMGKMEEELKHLKITNNNLKMELEKIEKNRDDIFQLYHKSVTYFNQLLMTERGKKIDPKRYIEKKHICQICDYRTHNSTHLKKHLKSKTHIDLVSASVDDDTPPLIIDIPTLTPL